MKKGNTYGDKELFVACAAEEIGSIQDEATERGWRLVNLWHWEFSFPSGLVPRGALVSMLPDNKRVRALLSHGCKVVRLGNLPHPDDRLVPAVLRDQAAAGSMAAEHFFELGFRDVAYFGREPWSDSKPLYDGFRQRAEALGMQCHLLRVKKERCRGEAWERRKQEVLVAWLRNLPKPVGLLGAGAFLTAQYCAWAIHGGLSVPQDVAVLSPGDTPHRLCANSLPRISSLDQDDGGRLRAACDLLDRMMAGDAAPNEPIMIPPAGIIRRESTDILATADRVVATSLRYMWDHLNEDVAVQQVADVAGLSTSQLQRRFRKALGRTVVQELLRKRLDESKRLLRSTELPIADIVPRLGFRSKAYFHQAFRKRFGVTPARYRREH